MVTSNTSVSVSRLCSLRNHVFFSISIFCLLGGQICRHLQLLVDSWGFEYWSTKHNSLWGFNQSQCLGSFRASVKIVIYCWKMLPGVQKVGWISMILNQIASPNETYICSIYQLATVSLGLCIFIYTGIYIYICIPLVTYICRYILNWVGLSQKCRLKCVFYVRCLELVRSIAMSHLGISHIGT